MTSSLLPVSPSTRRLLLKRTRRYGWNEKCRVSSPDLTAAGSQAREGAGWGEGTGARVPHLHTGTHVCSTFPPVAVWPAG